MTVGHLARSARLAVERRSTGGRKLISSENTDDLFKLIFFFYSKHSDSACTAPLQGFILIVHQSKPDIRAAFILNYSM